MSEISVKVHCPIGTEIKVFLNGEERRTIETTDRPSVVRIEQVPSEKGRMPNGEKLKRYYASVFGQKIRYGIDIPSPFRAVFEETVAQGTEGQVAYSLLCLDGHYRIVPEYDSSVRGSVRSYEENLDSSLWKVVLGSILLPMLIILCLGFAALWSASVPAAARAVFGTLYAVIILGGVFLFFSKTRRRRYYSTGVENDE